MKKKIWVMTVAIFVMVICLSACGRKTEVAPQEKTTLVLAAFDNSGYLQKLVDLYNQAHDEYQIEIQRYERSEQMEEDGILLLQREIASGGGPDIINFGGGYTTSDIVGAYTENLFSYMTAEEQEKYFQNIFTAFSYEENLYVMPLGFTLKSFAGRKSNLGERSSWTIGEMLECVRGQEKDRLLYPGVFKLDAFGTILAGSMDYYIDWETGECDFNGEEFRDMMEFCNGFSDHLEITEDFSVKQTFLDDEALLLPVSVRTVYDICRVEYIFDDQEVTFISFPVTSASGTMLQSCGPVLAISKSSAHKDAAWEFINWCMSESCQSELPSGLPICRSVLQDQIANAMEMEYKTDENGVQSPVVREQVIFEGDDPVDIYCITQKQADQLLALIEQAKECSQTDQRLYRIVLEEVEYYFSGAKSLEETADIMQSRVSLYVNERIK